MTQISGTLIQNPPGSESKNNKLFRRSAPQAKILILMINIIDNI